MKEEKGARGPENLTAGAQASPVVSSEMAPIPDLPEILRVKDFAKAVNVSIQTIYRLVEEGRVGYIRVSERCIRFRRQHVLDFLKECTFAPTEKKH